MCVMDVGKLYPVTLFRPGEVREGSGVPVMYRVVEESRIDMPRHQLFDCRPHLLVGAHRGSPQPLAGRPGARATDEELGSSESSHRVGSLRA